jgi:hypothetical protein
VTGLTSYQDSGLATASYHTYTVTAFDSSQNTSAQAPPIAVTTFAPAPSGVPAAYSVALSGLAEQHGYGLRPGQRAVDRGQVPGELLDFPHGANDNSGLRTNFTSLTAVDQEFNAAQSLGMNAVMVSLGFPIFDQTSTSSLGRRPPKRSKPSKIT